MSDTGSTPPTSPDAPATPKSGVEPEPIASVAAPPAESAPPVVRKGPPPAPGTPITPPGCRGRVLVLWNQVEEDIYERWREEGPKPLEWDPSRSVPDVGTVAEEMDGFLRALRESGHHVDIVNVLDDIDRVIGAVRLYKPDLVFNVVEYFNDDSIQETYIAGLYDLLGVPYTGNPPVALATCQNKFRTKLILEGADLPTADYFLCRRGVPIPTDHGLDFPLIVKPALEDASGGIEQASVVNSQEKLEERVRYVFKEFEMPALVEEYIDGREIHAAILGNDPPEVLPLFEMEFDDSEFNPEDEWRPQIISFRAKWDPHSKDFYTMDSVCPAEDLEPEMEERIRKVALSAYKALGCRDYARVDMRIDEEECEAYILEVNPNPDLIDGTAYIQCATASGRTYSQVLGEIAQLPLARLKKAKEKAAKAKAEGKSGLPSDHLLREWKTGDKPGGDHAAFGASVIAEAAAMPGGAELLGGTAPTSAATESCCAEPADSPAEEIAKTPAEQGDDSASKTDSIAIPAGPAVPPETVA